MKQKIIFLLLFVNFIVFAQQKQFTISWTEAKTISTSNYSIKTPAFNSNHYMFSPTLGLQFVSQWNDGSVIDETSVVLSKVKYRVINKGDLFDLIDYPIPSVLQYNLKNTKARARNSILFELSPIIKDANGTYKRVESFQINYKELSAKQNSLSIKKTTTAKALTSSVLASGIWYKFYIEKTGVHRITKSFLESLGVNTNTTDPRGIKIYGNGGDMIPFSNAVEQPFDITENAIKFVGEEDGVINNGDHILFYAKGPKSFNQESNTNINIYTDKTFYFLNISATPGKRISAMPEVTGVTTEVIDTFEDYIFHEEDIHNIGALGRRWFGERFDVDREQTFTFNIPDLVTSTPIDLQVYLASQSTRLSKMEVEVNGNIEANLTFGSSITSTFARGANYNNSINVNNSQIDVTLRYDNNGNPAAVGYLDFISITAERQLNFSNKQFQFQHSKTALNSGVGEYRIANSQSMSEVWDVTDIFNVTNMVNSNADSNFSFKTNLGEQRTYVAITPQDYFTPKLDVVRTVPRQDIKGTVFTDASGAFIDVDYIIIAPNNMMAQANRLANINKERYNLNVKVFGLNEIYNEFSTGNQDIGAIRNLVKYVYDNASSPSNRIKYLCLFGDASYDYKDRIPNNTNIVPSWHSFNSFSFTSSFISDDFYGMMDDNEGTMVSSDRLDIATGRILANSPQQANELIDKIENYYSQESFGRWRNNYVVVSDDVDEELEFEIQGTTDEIADDVTDQKPFVNVLKIHSDAFEQQTSSGGDTYPEVTETLVKSINSGALIINYFGHGGEDGLSSERIFSKNDINGLKNTNKLSCFVTVTCEFCRFDNPFRETAGELAFWNKNAGAINLISTTRQVFLRFGIIFNKVLGEYLFSFSDNDNFEDFEYPSVAEALRLAKIDDSVNSDLQRRLVFFIGDPAMKLSFPGPNVKLTKLNNVPIAQATDTLKALSKIKMSGQVTDFDGNVLTNYSGRLSTSIFDKFVENQTLGNDGSRIDGQLITLNFSSLGEVIYRGQATVENGEFDFEFIVPKDIRIPVGLGKVSFYSQDNNLNFNLAGADVNNVKIGGVNQNAEADNIGPVVSLFMNDENFVSGGITNQSPTLLVKLEDANGINTSSGIGHDIIAILDGDEEKPFVLNDFYETDLDSFQQGSISFPFSDLEPGLHTLSVRAWDVYNNSSVSQIQFVVFNENETLVIDNVLNYPNPFVNYTEFWFNHNSSTSLNVLVQVFTVSGKLVRTLRGQTASGTTPSSLSRDIVWDGRDDFGDKIGKGVYVYKLTVESPALNKKVEKIEKLVIL